MNLESIDSVLTLKCDKSIPLQESPNTANVMAKTKENADISPEIKWFLWLSLVSYGVYTYALKAYSFRLFAIKEFGPIIHEFDPYFNWRATQVR